MRVSKRSPKRGLHILFWLKFVCLASVFRSKISKSDFDQNDRLALFFASCRTLSVHHTRRIFWSNLKNIRGCSKSPMRHVMALLFIMLILAGDIELNPALILALRTLALHARLSAGMKALAARCARGNVTSIAPVFLLQP